jgi:hypothetical protein
MNPRLNVSEASRFTGGPRSRTTRSSLGLPFGPGRARRWQFEILTAVEAHVSPRNLGCDNLGALKAENLQWKGWPLKSHKGRAAGGRYCGRTLC